MVIQIDLQSLDESIKSEIIKDIETEFLQHDVNSQGYLRLIHEEDNEKNSAPGNLKSVKGIMLEEDENQINKIKHRIKDLFIKRAIGEYIVVKDETVNNGLIILGRGQGESAGMHHCRHCGMEFEDEIQLSNHLRMHFFI